MNIEEIKKKTIDTLARNDVEFAGIFGSHARGEAKDDSDVDILVRFAKPVSLLSMGGLQMDLSEALKKRVDVVTEDSLHPRIKKNILGDLKIIYER